MRLEVRGPGLCLAQLLIGLFESLFGVIALVAKACELFSQVAIVLGSVFGLLFPLLAALSEFGLLAHPVPPGQGLAPRALDAHGIRLTRIAKLGWLRTTKASRDRERNGHVVTRSTF
jgi:hypothetical protein